MPDGYAYRPPSEAQWEYACRADTKTSYALGSNVGKHINLGSKTVAVGSYKPNPWGLHDMHGNVHEWCLDWYGQYPRAVVSIDPDGPSEGVRRVIRGGSWGGKLADCRSAERKYEYSEARKEVIGFRICFSP